MTFAMSYKIEQSEYLELEIYALTMDKLATNGAYN